MLKGLIVSAALAMASVGAAHAATVVGFEGVKPNLTAGNIYAESGYLFTVLSGSTFGNSKLGNPGGALWIGLLNAPIAGDTISISRLGGGLFTLTSLNYRSAESKPSDQVRFQGRVEGSTVETSVKLASSSMTHATFDPAFVGAFDEIRLVVAGTGSTSLILDNMTFSNVPAVVPLPAGAFLLLGALGMLAVVRRRA